MKGSDHSSFLSDFIHDAEYSGVTKVNISLTDSDDRSLLAAFAKHGDEQAFRALVERYSGFVHGVGLRRTGRADWAGGLGGRYRAVGVYRARKQGPLAYRNTVARRLAASGGICAIDPNGAQPCDPQTLSRHVQRTAFVRART